jgi:hypothetical protein
MQETAAAIKDQGDRHKRVSRALEAIKSLKAQVREG